MGSRCTGHCCKKFCVAGLSPEQIQDSLAFEAECLAHARGELADLVTTRPDGSPRLRDTNIDVIADMVIYLGQYPSPSHGELVHYYTCRHLQPNGDCGNYDGRPQMCREFPYGRPCEYAGCTWDNAAAETAHLAVDPPAPETTYASEAEKQEGAPPAPCPADAEG